MIVDEVRVSSERVQQPSRGGEVQSGLVASLQRHFEEQKKVSVPSSPAHISTNSPSYVRNDSPKYNKNRLNLIKELSGCLNESLAENDRVMHSFASKSSLEIASDTSPTKSISRTNVNGESLKSPRMKGASSSDSLTSSSSVETVKNLCLKSPPDEDQNEEKAPPKLPPRSFGKPVKVTSPKGSPQVSH